MYNFDKIIERSNTDCLKYDFTQERNKPQGILPLWVADMDFRAPDEVIKALEYKCNHGIFGYSDVKDDYFQSLRQWYLKYHNWNTQSEWLIKTPGVVFTICALIRALTNEGDSVIIQQPVYYPFANSIIANNRNLVISELIYNDGKYTIDFNDFENKIKNYEVKIFILCNPHNPVGRVWTEAELIKLGDICIKHGVVVISDEIHADFVYEGNKHTVFANIKVEFADISVICTSPAKTFNLAGLHIANIFIPNSGLREIFKNELDKVGFSQSNIMGLVGSRAAYSFGYVWYEELKIYLAGNLKYVRDYLKQNIPNIKLVEPEGTYLVWLDCSALNLTDSQLNDLIINKANLWLDAGKIFGAGGKGFQRVNIACPRVLLEKALCQLQKAINL